ncbi:MAG: HAD family hydrolase [Armatimonadetes bacterium]|nr:HAD family hydrolase [Armatimonadota bacterium]
MGVFKVEAVLFDFDGTLVTLEIDFTLMRNRVNEVIASFGVPSHILTAPFSWERIEQAASWLAQFDIKKAKDLERVAKGIIVEMEDEAAKIAEPPKDVLPTLQTLKAKGIKVGLVTRNSMNAVKTVLSRHPLPFDVIVTRDHVHLLKPNPEHLLFALKRLNVNPYCRQFCATFVGDHLSDIQVALKIGLVPIGIAQDELSRQNLQRAGAFAVIMRLCELVHLLQA